MGLTGPIDGLRRLHRATQALATPGSPAQRRVLGFAAQAVKALLRQQFAEGIGPDGAAQPTTKGGHPGLVSRKLPNAINVTVEGTGIRGAAKNAHAGDILESHQEGHVFPPRKGRLVQYRDKKDRLISFSSFVRKVAGTEVYEGRGFKSYVLQTARGPRYQALRITHEQQAFGERVLPVRRIHPTTAIPTRWGEAIARACLLGLRTWFEGVR